MLTHQKHWFLRWKCPECGAKLWESDEGDFRKTGGLFDCTHREEEEDENNR